MGNIADQNERANWLLRTIFVGMCLVTAGCTGDSVAEKAISRDKTENQLSLTGLEPQTVSQVIGEPAQSSNAQAQSEPGSNPQQNRDAGSPPPSVSLQASSDTVEKGGVVTLSWNASEADTCIATGAWSGQLGVSGSRLVGPLETGTTYGLRCAGQGGSALDMLSVAVVGPVKLSWVAPEENIDGTELADLAGYRIYYGEASRTYSEMVEIADPRASAYTLNLKTGDYFVAVTAFDSEGHESDYSNEVVRNRP